MKIGLSSFIINFLKLGIRALSLILILQHQQVSSQVFFNYTGGVQSYTVPALASVMSVTVAGAQGGSNLSYAGALGAIYTSTFSVVPGQVFQIYVGGAGSMGTGAAGGYNGGGQAGGNYNSEGSGGGASDIRVSPFNISNRIIVAGGGGGGGGWAGAPGGAGGIAGYAGGTGQSGGGAGGTAISGGGGGFPNGCGGTGGSGSLGQGGAGGVCSYGGGGGGGGYYGGGGGGADTDPCCADGGGGGGGSSYSSDPFGTCFDGAQGGNGQVIVCVNVSPPPTNATALGNSTVCAGNSTTLSATSVGGTINWFTTSTGGTSVGTGTDYITPPLTANTTFYAENYICVPSTSRTPVTVTVVPLPVVTANTNSAVICAGNNVILTGGSANTYTWSGGITNGVPFSLSVTSTFSVDGTSLAGCTSTNNAAITITVNPIPGLVIGGTTTICNGITNTLNVAGASTYLWNTSATTSVISISPSSNTTYSVIGTSAAGCQNTASVAISVIALPVVSSTVSNSVICNGATTTLNGLGANTYTWSGGVVDGTAFSPTATASYTVTGTSTLTGCTSTNSAVRTITVNSLPTITVSASNSVICFGNTTTLTATGALTYTWNPGSITSTSISASPGATTNYTVSATDANGCQNTANKTITVIALPIVSATSANSVICFGNSSTITASGANTYTWNPGSITGTNFTVTPASTSTYSIVGTSTAGCISSNTAVITITVNALPIVTASSSNSVICFGNTTTVNGGGADTYTWTGGITNAVSFSAAVTSTYSVNGTNTLTGCTSTNSAVQTISVNALPTLTTSATNSVICFGNSSTLSVSGASTYTWNPGSTVATTINVTPSSTTNYTVTGLAASTGCSNTAVRTITVNPLPVVTATTSLPNICMNSNTTLNAGGANTYTWVPGLAVGANHVVSPPVFTTYTVTGTSLAGCTSTNLATQTVSVIALPNVTASVSNPVVCFGSTTTLNGSGANTYTWTGGAINATPFSPTITTTYTLTGTNTITGCTSTNSAVQTITVNQLPLITANATNSVICNGGSTTLSGGNAITYTWTGGISNGVAFSPTVTTTYTVTGTDANGCVNTATRTIAVSTLPTVTASISNSIICAGTTATLTGNGANTYTWNPGLLVGAIVTVTPAANTSYTLIGTNVAGCTNTNSAISSVTVNALPTVTASTTNSVICFGVSSILNGAGATTYTWTGGITNGSSFSPTATTSYSLSGTNALTGCTSTNSAVQTITVNPLPVITVSASSSAICLGSSTTLTASGANTYTCNPGALTGSTISVSPTLTTTYTFVGTSTAGCTNTNSAIQTITVNAIPQVNAAVSNSVFCFGGASTFSASGASTYTWNPGNILGSVITVTPASTTIYTLSGTSTAGCTSTNNAVASVTVNALPIITIATSSPAICFGNSVALTASGASTYTWSSGITNSIAFTPTATATYTAIATDSNNCQNTANVTVTVSPIPTVSATVSNTVVCLGDATILNASGAVSYTWNPGNLTSGSPSVTPNSTTSYSLVGTNSVGCQSTNSAVVSVSVNPLPVLSTSVSNNVICMGQSVTVSGSGASTYTWSTNVLNNVAFSPTLTSTYTLTGTDANSCSNTAIASVTVNALPTITIAATTTLTCEAESVTLTASGAATYTWNAFGTVATQLVVTPTINTSYTVTGVDANGCINSAQYSQSVMVCPGIFTATTKAVELTCSGKNDGKITVESTISYINKDVKYIWNPASLCPNNDCKIVDNLKAGRYGLTVKVTYTINNTVVRNDSIVNDSIIILDQNGPCNLKVFTGFTPNADGVNDTWQIENITEFPNNNVSVFNRWGQQVFQVKGYDNKTKVWPTADQLSKLPSSTYYYVIELGDGSKPIKGWLELIK